MEYRICPTGALNSRSRITDTQPATIAETAVGGCDVGAFFSPTWFTIPDAERTRNLTLLTDALVRSVLVDEDGMAKGVAYVDRGSKTEVEVYAKVIVLAASCVETAHIMLNSKFQAMADGHREFKRPTRSQFVRPPLWNPGHGYLPQLVGQPPTPDNIASSTVAWMPRWQNLKNPREEKFIRGYSVYIGGGCAEFPGYYRAPRRFWSRIQTPHQALLSRSHWVAHTGAFAAQPHQLRRH